MQHKCIFFGQKISKLLKVIYYNKSSLLPFMDMAFKPRYQNYHTLDKNYPVPSAVNLWKASVGKSLCLQYKETAVWLE